MQRTIRILRVALPLVLVGFIVLLAATWTKKQRVGERPPGDPIKSTRKGEQPKVLAFGFEDTQTIGGRVVSRIRAKEVVVYDSSWNTLKGVELTIYRPNNLTYELSCPQAQFNSKTKEADAKGGVKLTSSDGVEITTAEIKFDGNRLTNDIPVQFKIDQWRGNAGALDLDVKAELLALSKRIDATMTPIVPTEAMMTLGGEGAVFRRSENDVTFSKDVVLTRLADRLQADKIVGRFTQDRKMLVGLEGEGNVLIGLASNSLIAPTPGAQPENLGGKKTITCAKFYSELGGDGKINAIQTMGEGGQTHAVLEGPPARDIVARNIRFALADKVLTEIRADWDVVMKELGPEPRELKADRVTVAFDQATRKASNAYLDNNVKYKDPKNQASAIKASYDIINDRVLLTSEYGFDATVISEGHVLKAKQIEFAPKGGTAKATGEVIAQLTSKGGGASADSTGLFPAGKPVFVNADLLNIRQATKTAVFSGNVRAWQDTNTVFAQELHVQGAGDSITARGGVRTTLYNTTGEARREPVQSQSDQLFARKTERRIDMTGNVKIEDETRTLTSERASFFFDANRKLERVESEHKVVLVEKPTSRKITGDKATYQVARKMIFINGSPATATAPNGTFSGQQIAFDLNRNKVEIVSTTSATQGTYKQ